MRLRTSVRVALMRRMSGNLVGRWRELGNLKSGQREEKSEGFPLSRFAVLQGLTKPLQFQLQVIRGHGVLVAHDDELHRHEEDSRLEHQIVRHSLHEEC